jgi:speckle-type POZ protein
MFRSKCPICAFESTAAYYSSHPVFQLILKFEEKRLADLQADELQVKLIVGGQEMAAHLRIIASASPVMAAMFAQNQFEEGYSRVAKIEDIAPEVFQGMLRYLHTGQVPDMSRLVDQWFLIADMYDISQLKNECTSYWMSRLTLKNVIHLMMLAFQHNDSVLLQAALHFTAKNEDKVWNIPGWRSLAERAPEIFQLAQRMFSVEKVAGKQSRKRRWHEI